MAIVITHSEMGIYLGNCMGLGFWSKLDSVGQDAAVTFPDEDAARVHVSTWDENNSPNAYSYSIVSATKAGGYASIQDLKAAGLCDLLGDMESDALRYAEPVGTA